MPVVIPPAAFDVWLDGDHGGLDAAMQLVVPAPNDFFVAHEVSAAVNRAANDSPDVLRPVTDAERAASAEAAPRRGTTSRGPARNVAPEQGSLF
jgi:hypothetical protein